MEDSLEYFAGSHQEYDYELISDIHVAMRDGIHLATDVYLPKSPGGKGMDSWPVVIERSPYDKGRPWHSITGRYFARRGYATIMQDVRGRGKSGGEFEFLRNEAEDGFDTLAWLREQPWCSGKIATIGLSYTTANQQATAVLRPEGLVTQLLFDGGFSYYHQTMRHAGACEYGVLLQYGVMMARTSQEAARDARAKAALDDMWNNLDYWMQRLPLRRGQSPLALIPGYENWFFDMVTRADYDEFWQVRGLDFGPFIQDYPDIPVFLETSWYGNHITATLKKWARLTEKNKSPVKMLMGTWLHSPDTFSHTFSGNTDFGALAALENVNDVRLRWLDHFVKGMNTGLAEEPPIRLFVMGGGTGRKTIHGRLDHGGVWRDEHEWPLKRTRFTKFFLRPDGGLDEEAPAVDAAPSSYVFDPDDPCPTVGGNFNTLGTPRFPEPGGHDQREPVVPGRSVRIARPLAARHDVLVFRTPPLTEDVEVTGPIEVNLWVSTSAVDTDFTAKLIDEYPPSADYPQGYALNITDSIVRMRYHTGGAEAELVEPGRVYEITIEPQATSNLFAKGHAIRLDISSSNFPHYDVNPNTGEPLGLERDRIRARQKVFHDAERPSHIVLPLVGSK